MNGDVVFDARVLERVKDRIKNESSFVCVNTAAVGEEEIKYTVNANGNIQLLSKQVKDALGEAGNIFEEHRLALAVRADDEVVERERKFDDRVESRK